MIPAAQAPVVGFLAGLAGAGLAGAGLAGAGPIETHISVVFVGRDTVWKLKKAVRLSFLDFSRVEERGRLLRRELELNRRSAPGMYRDVVAVVRRGDGFALEADAEDAVDWVLRMARVPATDFLDRMAAEGRVGPALLSALADAVAVFHQGLAACDVDPLAALLKVAEGNDRAAREVGLPVEVVDAVTRGVCAALRGRAGWFAQRRRDGFVRRAHGDLHLGNVCLWQGRPVPFDALEFDEDLATIDLGYDLAFLLMDVEARLDRAAANAVLNRYVARTGDVGLTTGLVPFLSLRAMVRAHVLKAQDGGDWQGYLETAAGVLPAPAPVMVAVGGLQGTGKTTLARALGPRIGGAPGALVLRSDETRKRLQGRAPEERLPAEAYSAEANRAVDAALVADAARVVAGGHSVVVDATFLDVALRAALRSAAERAGVSFVGLWLQAPMAELERRIAARTGDASDATVKVLRQAVAHDPGAGDWVMVPAVDWAAAQDVAMAAVLRATTA